MVRAMPFTTVQDTALNSRSVPPCSASLCPTQLYSTMLCPTLRVLHSVLCPLRPQQSQSSIQATAQHITSQRSAAIVMTRIKSFLILKGNVLERTDTFLKNVPRTSDTAVVGSIASLHLLRLRI